jgi:excisionase family DNA binding protein
MAHVLRARYCSLAMGDHDTSAQSTDATRIAAALSAFLDLPRIMRELEVTLRQLRSVVTSSENRRTDRLADAEHGLWDANQVARYLRVSRSWVYHRAESGLLACRRVGGLLRFEADAIQAYARTGMLPEPSAHRAKRQVGFVVEPPLVAPAVKPSAPVHAPPPEPSRAPSPAPAAPAHQQVGPPPAGGSAQEKLLGVRQVAERLRISTATVYKLCDKGELPHTRFLNVIRVAPAELDAFIARRASRPTRSKRKGVADSRP